jgi:acylphosphatase
VSRARVLISGLVQGVTFRESCRRAALARGVTGWVRNLPDGRVEAVFEGAAQDVDALVAWAHHGPSAASVSDVAVTVETSEGLIGFAIRY